MHRRLAVAVATAITPLVFAAPALADTVTPTPLSFDHVVLDTPATGEAPLVSDSTQPLAITADLDTTTGAFTVDPTAFSAPSFTFTKPIAGSASVALASPASGTVDFATGAVTMTADFLTTINLGADGSCTVDTGDQTLTTATTKPLAGQVFATGPTGVLSSAGAFGVGWSTLPASTDGSACALVNNVIDGPGGLWISRDVSPNPKLSLTLPEKTDTTTLRAKAVTVRATLANSGGPDPTDVKVCLAPKSKRLTPARRCDTVTDPGAGVTKTLSFRLDTAKLTTTGSYKLTLTATGLKAATVTLKVTR